MQQEGYTSHLHNQGYHWWYNARQKIIETCLNDKLAEQSKGHPLNILDIGSGGGRILHYLKTFGTISAVDMEPRIVSHIQKEFGEGTASQGKLPNDIPFKEGSFDMITALDVLEHVEEDVAALNKIYSLLKPGGLFFMTVPAYPFLWSYHDVQSHHVRRYTKKEIQQKLKQTSFQTLKLTYFNTFLFPPAALYRLLKNTRAKDIEKTQNDMDDFSPTTGKILEKIFSLEAAWLKKFSFPFGVSLLAILRK